MKRTLPFASLFSLGLALLSPLPTLAATGFNAGDLIKASNPAVYYFAPNGKRYVFPNDKTYFTWYTNFSGVKTISDAQLAAIPLGGNVTYKPGRKMVKITTDPRTYVVDEGGVLRHVKSEQIANTLYGISWKNQIDDLSDAFFTNYRVGTPIEIASEYRPADTVNQVKSIAQDKQIVDTIATITISTPQTGFVPASITVKRGTSITWTNNDIMDHNVTGSGWASGTLKPGQAYTRTFNTAGAFDYKCSFHPGTMQGTVNVQ